MIYLLHYKNYIIRTERNNEMNKLGAFYCQIHAGIVEKGFKDDKEAFEAMVKEGVTGIDFNSKEITESTPELLASTGTFAASVHGAITLNFKTDKEYNESTARMKEAIDKAIFVKSPFFMSVPQRPKEFDDADDGIFRDASRAQITELCEYVKDKPITVTVEDYSTTTQPYTTFEDIDRILNANPTLGFTYDSGNFPLAGFDEVEGARRYANRTVYVHLKDIKVVNEPTNILRRGKYYDSLELGGGYLNNREALRILKAAGYTGAITLEVNSPFDRFDRTVKSAEWIKKVLAEI